jgi:hypothetical protein
VSNIKNEELTIIQVGLRGWLQQFLLPATGYIISLALRRALYRHMYINIIVLMLIERIKYISWF